MQNTERAKFRKRAGLTQIQLGKKIGISSTQISLWETGQVDLPSALVDRIAHVLETELTKGLQISNAQQISRVLARDSA
jgi:transcriptional regulator with XRE-family HTH domain